MKTYNTLLFCTITLILLCLSSCKTHNKSEGTIIIVSISPLKYIVETITCGDFPIKILVPDGASPETYSPTANQMIDIESAKLVFTTGLIDFEHELTSKISPNNDQIVNLSEGIHLLSGTCGHNHNDNNNINGHNHSVDPHIWTSPKQLKVIAANTYKSIHRSFPDSVKYKIAYNNLSAKLDSLDNEISNKIINSGKQYFIIYHPALTYYANDYEISQISIEDEGKEPSAIHMQDIVKLSQANDINTILYQKQFSRTVVNSIAGDIRAEPIEINPLNEDIISEIRYITDVITR